MYVWLSCDCHVICRRKGQERWPHHNPVCHRHGRPSTFQPRKDPLVPQQSPWVSYSLYTVITRTLYRAFHRLLHAFCHRMNVTETSAHIHSTMLHITQRYWKYLQYTEPKMCVSEQTGVIHKVDKRASERVFLWVWHHCFVLTPYIILTCCLMKDLEHV